MGEWLESRPLECRVLLATISLGDVKPGVPTAIYCESEGKNTDSNQVELSVNCNMASSIQSCWAFAMQCNGIMQLNDYLHILNYSVPADYMQITEKCN